MNAISLYFLAFQHGFRAGVIVNESSRVNQQNGHDRDIGLRFNGERVKMSKLK